MDRVRILKRGHLYIVDYVFLTSGLGNFSNIGPGGSPKLRLITISGLKHMTSILSVQSKPSGKLGKVR
jgi:hypothetical protein